MIKCSNSKLINLFFAMFSVALATGYFMNHIGPIANWSSIHYLLWISYALLLFLLTTYLVIPALEKIKDLFFVPNIEVRQQFQFLAFGLILTAYIIIWLAYYPGLWNYDAWQVNQVINKEYTTWHPLLHTLLIGNLYKFGVHIGHASIGLIIYVWIQMLAMSAIFSHTCYIILSNTHNKYAYYVSVLFYAIFPFHSLMAISTTKDVLFSVFVCSFVIELYNLIHSTKVSLKNTLFSFFSGLLMLLFRNNAPHAFALFLFLSVIAFIKRIITKGTLITLFSILIAYVILNHALVLSTSAQKTNIAEAASIPSIQMGRLYCSGHADKSDIDIINKYINWNKAHYDEHLADGLKENLNDVNTRNNLLGMYLDSFKLFLKHPIISLDAFLYLHEGSWYPADTSFASIYGSGLDGRQGYFPTEIKEGYGIQLESKIPPLEHLMEVLFSNNEYLANPILAFVLSPAFYNWIYLGCLINLLRKKEYSSALVVSLPLCIIITTLLGPTVLVRYYYPIIVCCPLLLSWSFQKAKT